LGELHPVASQPIEMWRLVQIAAEAREICPAEIIGEDQHDIQLISRKRGALERQTRDDNSK
jgi:hypothetical protein